MNEGKRVSMSIQIDNGLWKRWKVLCVEEGRTISDYLSELIDKELAKKRATKENGND